MVVRVVFPAPMFPVTANEIDITIINPTLLVRYLAALAGTVRSTNINSAPTTGTVILVATDKRTKKNIARKNW
jgi:hypothetical protein